MARIKKTSKVIEDSKTRLASLKSIDEALDLGNGITAAIFEQKLSKTESSLESYNTSLSIADEKRLIFENAEKDLNDYHERVLLGVGSKFGKDSIEYEKAGGTRKSERRKPTRFNNQNNKS